MANLKKLKDELKSLEVQEEGLQEQLDEVEKEIAALEKKIEKQSVDFKRGAGILYRGMPGIVIGRIGKSNTIEAIVKEPRGYFEERIQLDSDELSLIDNEASEATFNAFRKEGWV